MQLNAKILLLTAWLALSCRTVDLPAGNDSKSWHEISSFSTSFLTGQEARNRNIRLAASILNGQTIEPGQTFSFNQTIGQRTLERGFVKAPSIEFGEKLNLEGGGICLVSSVLYASALTAGMEIKERYPHSRRVPYITAGSDATVDYGMKDLKFRNSLALPVMIETSIAGSRLLIRLMSSAVLPYRLGLTSTRSNQSDGMVRVCLFRTRSENGRVISDELISDDLYPAENLRSQEKPLEGGFSLSN